jgi:hypothetical protein
MEYGKPLIWQNYVIGGAGIMLAAGVIPDGQEKKHAGYFL